MKKACNAVEIFIKFKQSSFTRNPKKIIVDSKLVKETNCKRFSCFSLHGNFTRIYAKLFQYATHLRSVDVGSKTENFSCFVSCHSKATISIQHFSCFNGKVPHKLLWLRALLNIARKIFFSSINFVYNISCS